MLPNRKFVLLMLLVLVGWFGLITAISADESLLLGGKLNSVFILLYVIGVVPASDANAYDATFKKVRQSLSIAGR